MAKKYQSLEDYSYLCRKSTKTISTLWKLMRKFILTS